MESMQGRLTKASRDRALRHGFTLMEMMVVMILLVIVTAVVIPTFMNSSVVDPVKQATQPIVQLLRYGKQLSVESGSAVRVVIDPVTGAYLVTANQVDTAIASGVLELPASTRLVTDSLRAQFFFEPTGVSISDSLIVSSNGRSALIRVNRWTGAVNVAQ